MNILKKTAVISLSVLILMGCNKKESETQNEKAIATEEVETQYTLSEEYVQNVLENKAFVKGIEDVSATGNELKIIASIDSEFSPSFTYKSAWQKALEIYENINGLKGFNSARIVVNAPGVDKYGNEGDVMAIDVTLLSEDIEKINYENFDPENLKDLAKEYQTTE